MTPERVDALGVSNIAAAAAKYLGRPQRSMAEVLSMRSAEDMARWQRLDDVIMGGQSSSGLVPAEDGSGAVWNGAPLPCRRAYTTPQQLNARPRAAPMQATGAVPACAAACAAPPNLPTRPHTCSPLGAGDLIVEGGGFCGARTAAMDLDLSAYDGVSLRVKGDGQT